MADPSSRGNDREEPDREVFGIEGLVAELRTYASDVVHEDEDRVESCPHRPVSLSGAFEQPFFPDPTLYGEGVLLWEVVEHRRSGLRERLWGGIR